MVANNEPPERIELRKKQQRLQTRYDTLLNQENNTKGVFSGQQLSGGLAPQPSQIASARKAFKDAEAELAQYDASHPHSG